ncbi:myb-like protein X isoform X2 [Cydia fagiglandana]|uniref:myb-like protein X isoform X2 n=1 Tax=Cydia fagiglandana TaxID=1458189 RepID=UPI002FEE1E12
MDVLYDDLENYDDVEALNRLKTENSDLKHKLECCTVNMQKLQKDFDKLEAEFKRLESNYSSLLKISRAEIQRKTDMITNLNIEKDMLVIRAFQHGPAHKVQELIRNVRGETESKRKKKNRNKGGGPKGREEFIRRKSSRPQSPATSSNAAENSYKMIGNEIIADSNKSSRMDTQKNDLQKPPTPQEVFPDNRPSSPVADKRVTALSCPRLGKLSSDEEFEDMYSALKPKASREPERPRKRGRDVSQDGKMLYNSSHDRPLNYPDPYREQSNRHRAGRFSDTERITREKQYSEPDRNINRGKHHYDRNRNVSDLQHHRFSPERHRRGAKELGDDRYRNRRLESPPRERQRLESPPRERQRLESPPRERSRLGSPPQERQELRKRIRERRKSYHGRTGNNPEIHSVLHNIHGEYEEPQNKKPRIEPYPVPQEEKRPGHDKEQYHNESQPPTVGSHTYPSPDFSHTEESSNEPATAQTETRSRTSSICEDPRLSSDRYVKCSEGNKHISQSANANKIHLQPVDTSLWNFEEVQVPKALRLKPLEISEEHVDKMDIDKPLSSLSMESGEIRSDTETALDIYDFQEFNKQIGNSVPCINESQKTEIKPQKEKSPIDNSMLGDIGKRSDVLIKGTKTTRLVVAKTEKANNHRAAESMVSTSKDSHKVNTTMHCDNIKLPSVLHKLIHSMNEERLEGDNSVKNTKGEKDPKRIAASSISKSEKSKAKTKDERENQSESNLKTDNNKADKLEKGSEKEPKRIGAYRIPNKSDKPGSKTRDDSENQNKSDLETDNNKTDKLRKGSENEPKLIAAYRIPNKSDKSGPKTRENRENQNESDLKAVKHKTDKFGKKSEKEPKRIAAYRIPKKSEKSGPKTHTGHRENQNESDLETDNIKTDKPEKRSKKEPKRIAELELSGKKENESLRNTDKMLHKNVPEVKTDNLEKITEKGTEKEIKRITESNVSDRNEKSSLKTNEIEHKNVSDMKVKEKPVKETVNTVTVFREFEHRVYSRHIVEGDLELSDESNDEAQLKLEDKIEEKKKITSKSKSYRETSKDKSGNSETTRKTRSVKDTEKERNSMNKFSELFGDSSSLITPEDLNLATRTAHGLPADCCPPATEEAQDAIIEPENPLKAQTTEMYSKDFKESLAKSTVAEDKLKIKEFKDKTRTKHKQNKDDYVEQVGDVKAQVVTITESCSVSEGNLMSNTSNYTNHKEVSKLNEKVKECSKSNKRPKTKGEKKLSVSEHTEEINTNNIYISEPNPNNSPTMSDKENSSSNGNSERNISNEMARTFENPIVSSKISSTSASETNKERPQLNDSTEETNCSTGVQDVPNLAPVVEEPGLVTTVVISTGVQPLDSNSAQYVTPFSGLASSTPKDLSAINTSSEMESNVSHSAQVSVTISREDSGSQTEDVPDMRITCYRRRRRVLKR